MLADKGDPLEYHAPTLELGTWPELDWAGWKDTAETLQLYTQVVGKTRLALTPTQNHWWNVPLYVTARGLGTSAMPLPGGHLLEAEFDFLNHELVLRTSKGKYGRLALEAMPVSEFYRLYMLQLEEIGVRLALDTMPVEVKNPIRFEQDTTRRFYDRGPVERFWQALRLADTLLKRFSTGFYGKISPVHFFWGSFDLAVTRFNGKRAPARQGSDAVQNEAYSHEVISAGFWPGNGGYGRPAFYAYAAPVPDGLPEVALKGSGRFDHTLGEFLLDYDDLRQTEDPATTVLTFLQETYAAAADTARWNRSELDRNDAVGQLSTKTERA